MTRVKKYLAILRNCYSTKTADVQAEHKYTKANLCIRVQMSDKSLFRYNMIQMKEKMVV